MIKLSWNQAALWKEYGEFDCEIAGSCLTSSDWGQRGGLPWLWNDRRRFPGIQWFILISLFPSSSEQEAIYIIAPNVRRIHIIDNINKDVIGSEGGCGRGHGWHLTVYSLFLTGHYDIRYNNERWWLRMVNVEPSAQPFPALFLILITI